MQNSLNVYLYIAQKIGNKYKKTKKMLIFLVKNSIIKIILSI